MIILLVGTSISCSESEAIIDQVLDNVDTETGGIIRTIQNPPTNIQVNNPDNDLIEFIIEVQQGNGSAYPDFKEVRLYLSLFIDGALSMPILDANGAPTEELLISSYQPDGFTIGSNGLPRTTISYTGLELLAFFPEGIQLNTPITWASFRLELEMNNGNVYSVESAGGAISGPYFNAPFSYRVGLRL
ncbi:MAG: hypothetical protein R2781_05460 [Flavobacteriaceae bacterium]